MGGLLSKFRRGGQRETGSSPQTEEANLGRSHQSEPQLLDEQQDGAYSTDTLRSTKSEGGLLRGKKHGKKSKGSSSTLDRSNEELQPGSQKAGVSSRSSTLDRNAKSASMGKGSTLKGLFRSKSTTLKRAGGSKDSLDKKNKNQQHSSSEDVQGNFFTRLFRRSSRDLRKKHREPREQRSKSEEKELLTPPHGEEQTQENDENLSKLRSSSEEPQLKAAGPPSETPLLDTLQRDAVTQNNDKPNVIQERSNALRQVLSRSQEKILECHEERREFLMNKTVVVTPKSKTETKAADTGLSVSQRKEETKVESHITTTEETDSTEEIIFEQRKRDELTRKTESENQDVRLEDSYEIIDGPEAPSNQQAGIELKADLERLQWEAQKIRGSDEALKPITDEFEVLQVRQNEEFPEGISGPDRKETEGTNILQKTEFSQEDEDSSPKISSSENIDSTELVISEAVSSDEMTEKHIPHVEAAVQETTLHALEEFAEQHETSAGTAVMSSQQYTKTGEICTEATEADSLSYLQASYGETDLLIIKEERDIGSHILEQARESKTLNSDEKTDVSSEVKMDDADKEIPEVNKISDVKPTENVLIAEDSSKIEKTEPEIVAGDTTEFEMSQLDYVTQDLAENAKAETQLVTQSVLETDLLNEGKIPAEKVQEEKKVLPATEPVNREMETTTQDSAISHARPGNARDISVSEKEELPQSDEIQTDIVEQQELLQQESIPPVSVSMSTEFEEIPDDALFLNKPSPVSHTQVDENQVEVESELGQLILDPAEGRQDITDLEAVEPRRNDIQQESSDLDKLSKVQSELDDHVSSITNPKGSSETVMQADQSQSFAIQSTTDVQTEISLPELVQKSEENILDLEEISCPAPATLGYQPEERILNQTLFEATDMTKEQPLLGSETGDNDLPITTSLDQTESIMQEEQNETLNVDADSDIKMEEVCSSTAVSSEEGLQSQEEGIRQEPLETRELNTDQSVLDAQITDHVLPIALADNRTEPEMQEERSESNTEVQMEKSFPELMPKPEEAVDLHETSNTEAISTVEEKDLKLEPLGTTELDQDQSTQSVQKELTGIVEDVSSTTFLSDIQSLDNTSTQVPEDTTAMLQQVISDAYSAAIDELKCSLGNEEEAVLAESRLQPEETAVDDSRELLQETKAEDLLPLQHISESTTADDNVPKQECITSSDKEIENEGESFMRHEDTTAAEPEVPVPGSTSIPRDEDNLPKKGVAELAKNPESGSPEMFPVGTDANNESTTESCTRDDLDVDNLQGITDSSIPERAADLQEINSTEQKEDNSMQPNTPAEGMEQPAELNEPTLYSEKEVVERRSSQKEEMDSSDSSSCLSHEFIWDREGQDVYLCGSFNDWMPIPLSKSDGVYKVTLHIPEGKHYYRYIVDEQATVNPSQAAEGDLNWIQLKKAD